MSLKDNEERNTSSNVSDDEIVEPWENLLQHLTVNHLHLLNEIYEKKAQDSQSQLKDVKLSKEEFVEAIDAILGNSKYSLQAIALFNELPHRDEDKITWVQIADCFIRQEKPDDKQDTCYSVRDIFTVQHIKRESVIKIVLFETSTFFCYAVISKFGRVGLYDGSFRLLDEYNVMFMKNDPCFNQERHRRKSVWVTDALFIPKTCVFIVSNSCRSLTFYDASGMRHVPLYLIEGIPNAVQCLTVHSDVQILLCMGDICGNLIIMSFLKPNEELIRKKHNDKLSTYYWRELSAETSHVKIRELKRVHTNAIHTVGYYPELSTLISCSRDPRQSLSFFHLKRFQRTYSFRMAQGASCFSLCHSLHLLIMGNDNGLLQVWNTFVTKQPIGTLVGHRAAIVDVKIITHAKLIVTCSRDAVLKIWNLTEYKCLQSLTLKFPCFDVLGKSIEWGTESMYPGPKRLSEVSAGDQTETNDGSVPAKQRCQTDPWKRSLILVSCCNYIAVIHSSDYEKNETNNPVLPPPQLQNDIKVPNEWKINALDEFECIKPENLEQTPNYCVVDLHLLNKNIFSHRGSTQNINFQIACLEKTKSKMKVCVSQCAPYSALDLHEIADITLSDHLPVPDWKKTQRIVQNTHRLLSAASTISGILSDRYSRSVSSRSSVVEF